MSSAFDDADRTDRIACQTYPAQLLNLRLAEVYEYLTNSHIFNKLVGWGKWMLQEREFTFYS